MKLVFLMAILPICLLNTKGQFLYHHGEIFFLLGQLKQSAALMYLMHFFPNTFFPKGEKTSLSHGAYSSSPPPHCLNIMQTGCKWFIFIALTTPPLKIGTAWDRLANFGARLFFNGLENKASVKHTAPAGVFVPEHWAHQVLRGFCLMCCFFANLQKCMGRSLSLLIS